MDQIDLEERSGIYLFILPKWKMGYVGRTNNLKRRYEDHVIKGSHKKEIKNYLKKYDYIEFMILEYTDGYKPRDQAVIEKQWIEHYLRKGINLLNVTDPTKEFSCYESRPIIAYHADSLEFYKEWKNLSEAVNHFKMKNSGHLISVIKEQKNKFVNGTYFSFRKLFLFFKDEFKEELLIEKQKRYLESKENRKIRAVTNGRKVNRPIAQFTKEGTFIKCWSSIREAENILFNGGQQVTDALRNKNKKGGGYIWNYAEESELENESKRISNFQFG